jgi:hypothetical protein
MIRRAMVVVVLILAVSGPVYSGDGQGTVVKKEPVTGTQQKGVASWPQPFHPSKEVGADSQVSFPTDI